MDSPGREGLAHQLALIHYEDAVERVREQLGEEFCLADLAAQLGKSRVRDLIIQLGWNALRGNAAHRAIASLASEGFRVEIVTVNYDPLLERELRESNVNPEVISAAGMVLVDILLRLGIRGILVGDWLRYDERGRHCCEEFLAYSLAPLERHHSNPDV